MKRIWNLQTKIVALLVVLLLGSLLLQKQVHDYTKERLFEEVVSVAEQLAEKVSQNILDSVAEPRGVPSSVVVHVNDASQQTRFRINPRQVAIVLDIPKLRQLMFRRVVRKYGEYVQERAPIDEEFTAALLNDFDAPLSLRQIPPAAMTSPVAEVNPLMPDALNGSNEPAEIELAPYTAQLESIFEETARTDLATTVGIFLLGIAIAWFLGVRMTRPVSELVDGFQRVADGNLEEHTAVNTGGEFGFLSEQFNRMLDRLKENQQLERQLVQRERVQHMGDLAAGVAHDVRNPLNAIHLNVGQIRDEFVPDEAASRERFLRFTDDVQREVERLNEIVSSFLSLAQPASSDLEPVHPNDLLGELTRLLKKEASGRGVKLRVDFDDALSELMWNRQEMKSALLNIAINALQSMHPDGGSLDVITGIRGTDNEREVSITFVDTGSGISEDNLERIFIPYFTTRKGGTGLGLAVARRIVERNGGRIEVRSRLGEGTAVSFLFPLGNTEEGQTA